MEHGAQAEEPGRESNAGASTLFPGVERCAHARASALGSRRGSRGDELQRRASRLATAGPRILHRKAPGGADTARNAGAARAAKPLSLQPRVQAIFRRTAASL